MYIFEAVEFFFLPSGYPINSIFSVTVHIYKIHLFDEALSSYQNAHGHQTFYSRDLLRRVLTRKYS